MEKTYRPVHYQTSTCQRLCIESFTKLKEQCLPSRSSTSQNQPIALADVAQWIVHGPVTKGSLV